MASKKMGRPAGTKSIVLFVQPDADAWLRAEAARMDIAPSTLIELAIRRMMRKTKEPSK